jgi:hypothetical protein
MCTQIQYWLYGLTYSLASAPGLHTPGTHGYKVGRLSFYGIFILTHRRLRGYKCIENRPFYANFSLCTSWNVSSWKTNALANLGVWSTEIQVNRQTTTLLSMTMIFCGNYLQMPILKFTKKNKHCKTISIYYRSPTAIDDATKCDRVEKCVGQMRKYAMTPIGMHPGVWNMYISAASGYKYVVYKWEKSLCTRVWV